MYVYIYIFFLFAYLHTGISAWQQQFSADSTDPGMIPLIRDITGL